MNRALTLLASLSLGATAASAADLKPDATTEIPAAAQRPTVVNLSPAELRALNSGSPKADLPAGYELQTIAAPPLVTHPIMGCLDDRGRLFVGDATGVNWNKKQLEENPPNRVLMLEDTDGDGIYDKSTVFADKMTFPQGGCWLNGSLYVGSPPGIWKLTDTNGDGVADQREMIVSGFEYTGNAADIHGPWLHPNGRLYWCHGRKGHKATDRDGKVVHEGLACGIWSCKPDGRDLQWHALGCGDNPVKVDFTPEGEIIGVQNLYYTNPRGDTIVHWLHGGVYERGDQLKAIEGLPRTLEHMPVMHNFGHVAVSGCCFWRGFPTMNQDPGTLNFMVTHFNTQRVVRMELTPDVATYKATENEFLRLHDPDVHFTDVIEDADGSLIVINTGGWFRIGCPSSLMAKPDVLGAVYRVRKKEAPDKHWARARFDARDVSELHCSQDRTQCKAWTADKIAAFLADDRPWVADAAARALAKYHPETAWLYQAEIIFSAKDAGARCRAVWSASQTDNERSALLTFRALFADDARVVRTALNASPWMPSQEDAAPNKLRDIVRSTAPGNFMGTERNKLMLTENPALRAALLANNVTHGMPAADIDDEHLAAWLASPLSAQEEHALIFMLGKIFDDKHLDSLMSTASNALQKRRVLMALHNRGKEKPGDVIPCLGSDDDSLARTAASMVAQHPDWDEAVSQTLANWLESAKTAEPRLRMVQEAAQALITQTPVQNLVGSMLSHPSAVVRRSAWAILAGQSSNITNDAWLPPLEKALAEAKAGDLPLLLDAVKKLKTTRFDEKLQSIAGDTKQALSLRLRALSAVKGLKLTPETLALLQSVLTRADSSAAARIQAATMLASAPLKDEDISALAPLFGSVGPIEFKELLAILRKTKDAGLLRTVSLQIAKSPVIASQQESIYRTALADKPTEIFESIILPAYRKATEAAEAKKRQLGPLADKAAAQGDAKNGRAIYESGRGTCIACHQIGDKGRSIGPNLSHIGAIRTERDLLESILFPSNTLARDYEAHVIETSDGQSTLGVIKSHTAEGLLVVDAAGQEKNIPHGQIVGDTQLPVSLMPMGLDQTLPEKELCDLVAYLRSLK